MLCHGRLVQDASSRLIVHIGQVWTGLRDMSVRLVIWRQVRLHLLHVEGLEAGVATAVDGGQLSLGLVLTRLLLLLHFAGQDRVQELLLLLLLLLSQLLLLDLVPLLASHSLRHCSCCCRGDHLLLPMALIQLFLSGGDLGGRRG